MKKLTRSRSDRRIAGVCGGVAAYFGVDPTAVRVAYILATVLSGFVLLIIAYVACWIIMPEENSYSDIQE